MSNKFFRNPIDWRYFGKQKRIRRVPAHRRRALLRSELLEARRLLAVVTPEVEPNDSRFLANEVSVIEGPSGSGYHAGFASGTVDAGGTDYFTFTALAGDQLTLSVDATDGQLDPEVILRNSAGGELRRDRDSGPDQDSLTSVYTVPTSGRFYAEVIGDSTTTSGPYQLRIDLGRGIDLETDANYTNDATGGADGLSFEQTGALRTASVAGTVMGAESSNTDQDIFALGFMRADSLISLSLDLPEWSTLSPTLEILDSSGAVVAEASDSGPHSVSFNALVDGNYFARVRTELVILNGRRLMLTDQADDWGVVRAEAQAAGGDLVSIGSFEENQLIDDTFGGNHWIGFTDQASEGTYQWSDGSPVTYTRWGNNEPNTPSYDHAYLSSNSYWYDRSSTSNYRGIIETSSEVGDPLVAHAGAEAQYVLSASVELRDLVPPVVTAVNRLPAEDGTLEQVLSTFNVTFSELDPETLSDDAFDLRAAGNDGVFDTADDHVYGLSYSRDDLTLFFTVTDGPLVDGQHRFTIFDSLTDLPVAEGVPGNALDGDADGTAGGDFIRSFTIDAVPDGVVFEGLDNGSFDKATPLELIADANGTGWLRSEVGYGSIDPAPYASYGEHDWWSFEAQAGDRVDVWSQQLEGLRPYAQLYRLNDTGDGVQSLAGDGTGGWSGPGNDAYISGYELPATTTYYVRMGKYYYDQTPGGYDVRVNIARGLELETDANYANDTMGGADGLTFEQSGALRTASVAGTVMGAESSNTDEDLFALGYMRADSLISLSLDLPQWSTLLPTLEILDVSGEVVAEATDAAPLSMNFSAPADGSYFARVRTEVAILNGSRFTLTDQSDDWDVVRAEAQAAGGDLVSIGSFAENELIHDAFGGSHWIGFTDQASEGTYQWIDGSPVTYTGWAGNEPNTPSYDHAYLSSNSYWYDYPLTGSLRGIIETSSEAGDPVSASAGIEAQYVLSASVELRDLVPPVVTSVNRFPSEGGTLEQVLSTFNVTLSELDPTTPSDEAFDLRAAGTDGVFDTADDHVYGLSYSLNGLTLNFTVTDGPLVDGQHRFTISDSLTDLPVAVGVPGNSLDGDADGTAGESFIRSFTVDAIPDGVVFEGSDNGSFDKATPLELTADANGTGWLRSEVGYGSIDPVPYASYGEHDWWSFEGQAGDRVDVWSQQLEGLRPYAQLYRLNDAGDGVQSLTGNGNGSWSGPGNDAYISGYELPATTTYYVRMGKYYYDQTPGGYDVRVNIARGLDLETDANYANDTTGGADGLTFEQSGALRTASVAGTVMGAESSNTDEDLFALGYMRADSLISLSLDLPQWSTLAPTLEVLDASGVVVAEATDADPLSMSFTALADGNYFARVRTEMAILDGSRYTLTDQADDWDVVRSEAQAAGGDLVSIGSFAENEWIHNTFGGSHWIGFTDHASEGTYQWSDGSPVAYTRWGNNEPNTPSYDHAYLSSNGFWYDVYSTYSIQGVIETAAEVDDPQRVGAGVQAQYVLNASVELRDLVPPVVTTVNRLPAEDGTLDQVLSTFNVTFSELDPNTISGDAFDLRTAGNDGVFDTADDHVYGLSYSRDDLTLYFTATDGPLADGQHRFTIADSLTDLPVAEGVAGNALDGDADGTAGGDFVRSFVVEAVPEGVVFEGPDNDSYEEATPLQLTADANGTGWLRSEVGYGSIDPAPYGSYGEYDWWSFEGQAGDHVDVWSQQLETLRPYAQLYRLNDAGDGVLSLIGNGNGGWAGPDNDAYISGYELPTTTTYFVRMGKYYWDQTPGGYDVRVNIARGLDLETDANYANDTTGGADGLTFEQSGALRTASVAGTVMGAESTNLDEDQFALGFMRADSLISLSLDLPEWSTLAPTLEIVDAAGEVVAEASDADPLTMHFSAPVDGNYFARVRTELAILNGSRYALTDQSAGWDEVRAEAQAAGGDLVSIGSLEENKWIHDTFGGSHWIGLTDQASEGTHQWSDGAPVTFTRWANNEPNTPSYDHAYLSSNGYWYDYPASGNFRGIIKSSVEAGDPLQAGAGVEAQYVLNASVELRDLIPPVVTTVNRLPAEGGTLEQVLSTFDVTFSELDPETLSTEAFDLRAAGSDGVFDTADDHVYGLSHSRSDLTVHFTVTDGPLVDGEHRFTIADSLTDLPVAEGVAGNALDGDADGTAGGNFIRSFTIDAVPEGGVFEGPDNDSYEVATPLQLTADANGTGWLRSEVGYGSIDPAPYGTYGEYDWWSFEGQAGDRVDVWSQQLEGLRPYAQLYRLNDAGDGVLSLTGNGNGSWAGPDNDAYISGYELPTTTTYYVRMGKYYWDQTPGGYDVRVNIARGLDLETDAHYANDNTGGADVVTRTVDGDTISIAVAGTVMRGENSNVDEDYFNIGHVTSDQTILARVRLPEYSTLVPVLEIRNANNEVISLSPNPVDANVVRADVSESGIYYIDVVGFDGEGPDAAYVIDVSIQPTSSLDFADLSVSELTISDDTLESGQQVEVHWTVGNFGAVDTQGEQWGDRVILSLNDRVGDADDIHLADVPRNGVLAVNDTYTQNAFVQLPIGVSGDYQVLVKTDATDQIAEFLFEDNNVRSLAASGITLTPYADLHATEVVAPELAIVGEPAMVTWNVTNAGTGITGDGTPGGVIESWVDRIYVSTDSTFGNADDRLIAEVTRDGSLDSGESYSGSWTGEVPADLEGLYHWFVQADNAADVYEFDNARQNVVHTDDVSVIVPERYVDLLPSELYSPTTATSGQILNVTWTTANQGLRDASGPWIDRLYLSADPTLSGDDTLLHSATFQQSIGVDDSEAFTIDLTLPERIEGDHYLILVVNANGSEFEFAFGNNNTIASEIVAITRRPEPDLVPAINNAPPTIQLSIPFDYSFTIANTGEGNTVDTWIDQVYLSSDVTFDSSDILLSEFVSPAASLPLTQTGAGYLINGSTTLPFGTDIGQYHLLVVTDSLASELETDEANNIVASPAIQVEYPLLPDLVVTNIETVAEVIAGQSIEVSWTIENLGDGIASGPWRDRIFYSLDDAIGDDVSLGQFDFAGTLAPGASITRTQTIAFPGGVSGPVRLVVGTDRNNLVFELAGENNNEAIDDQTLSVIAPANPNLVVDSIVAPATAFSNQEVTIEWVTENAGSGSTNALFWSDAVYLSLDDTLDGNDRFLGSVQNGSYLNSGESYRSTLTARLPQGIENNYRFIVVADRFNSLVEPDAEDDNIRASAVTTVSLTPPPDLIVANLLSSPSQVFAGEQLQLSWQVINQGTGPTLRDNWVDQVFISFNGDDLDNDDQLLRTVSHSGALGVGESYSVGDVVVNLPAGVSSPDTFVIVRTDGFNQVFEHVFEVNNATSRSQVVAAVPPPDLEVTEIQAPTAIASGQPLTVTYTVENLGPTQTLVSQWDDTIYLSPTPTLDLATSIRLGTRSRSGVLTAGQAETRSYTFNLSSTLTGTYYVIVSSDSNNRVDEDDNDNNVASTDSPTVVTFAPPDLVVSPVTVLSTPLSGQNLTFEYAVTNQGQSATPINLWSDAVYLSRDAVIDDSDMLLTQASRAGVLTPGGSELRTITTQLPVEQSGEFFIIVSVDSSNRLFELDDANNASAVAVTVQDNQADLTVTAFSPRLGASPILIGSSIAFDYTVRNRGMGGLSGIEWTDRIVLSSDEVVGNNDDVVLGNFASPISLGAGQEYTRLSRNFAIPTNTVPGSYQLFLATDSTDQIDESFENNNASASQTIEITQVPPDDADLPDLQVAMLAVPASAGSGQAITVDWSVSNFGLVATKASTWTDQVWLSTDNTLDDGDTRLGSFTRSSRLDAGQSYARSEQFTLGMDLVGDYFIIVETDAGNVVVEGSRESNNARASDSPMAVSLSPTADLQIIGVTPPSTANSGRPITISWEGFNAGGGDATGTWADSVYLSLDQVFDRATDIPLGFTNQITAVAAGTQYTATGTFNVPSALGGLYYVFVVADSTNRVYERGAEDNNAGYAAQAIDVVYLPPADLIVGDITIPATGSPGQDATIGFTINNDGVNAATGSWTDVLYISADDVWDIDDALFGRVVHTGAVPAGGSYSSMLTAPLPGIVPGDYRVIVRSDIRNNLTESDETNNLSASLDSFVADSPELTLGVTTSGTVRANGSTYYRVNVEVGETLVIDFDASGESNFTELYASFGDVPRRNRSDFRSIEPFTEDHRIVVPVTRAGTYYIMAYGTDLADQPAAFDITARTVNFSVFDTDFGDIGATSSVQNLSRQPGENLSSLNTLKISGAKFTGLTTAALQRGDLVFDAVSYWMTDTSTIYATFDLSTADFGGVEEFGRFDLRVDDPTGGSITVPDSVNVVPNTRNEGRISTRFDGASSVQIGGTYPVAVQIGNDSTADAYAPLITISSERANTPFGTSPNELAVQTVQFLGIRNTGPAGIYSPGDTGTFNFYFGANTTSAALDMGVITAQDQTPINWEALKESLRPSSISVTAWNPVFENITSEIVTWGDYVVMLNENATALSQVGERVSSIDELWSFELQHAMGSIGPIQTLVSATDASLPTPGLRLELTRSFGASIADRKGTGLFGAGWSTTWDSVLIEDAEKSIQVLTPAGLHRRYVAGSTTENEYLSQSGDPSVIRNINGQWLIYEPDGTITGYRTDGKIDYLQDTNGNRISASYSNGVLSQLRHSNGSHLTIESNANGQPTRVTDSAGRVTTYIYNVDHMRLETVIHPNGQADSYTYETSESPQLDGALASRVTRGTERNFTYSESGLLKSVAGKDGDSLVQYHSLGNGVIDVVENLGATRLSYGSNGLLRRSQDSHGQFTTFIFGEDFRLSEIVDPLLRSQLFEWDETGSVVSVTDQLGHTTKFTYEWMGEGATIRRMTSFTDANGNSTLYDYDSRGNLTSTIYPDQSVEEVREYDLFGNPVEHVNRRSQVRQDEYNSSGQLVSQTFDDGTVNSLDYDDRGNLTTVAFGDGRRTTYSYDDFDQLRRIDHSDGTFLAFHYDSLGRRQSMLDHSGYVVFYTYASTGQLQAVSDAEGLVLASYSYGQSGRIAEIRRGNQTTTSFTYDSSGQIAKVENNGIDGGLGQFFFYEYDALGRRTRMENSDGVWLYNYDARGQLIAAEFDPNPQSEATVRSFAFEYDAAGNRVSSSVDGVETAYTTNMLNQYTQVGDKSLSYDADGNLASVTGPDGITSWIYDQQNRVLETIDDDGVSTFAYDIFGRRISETRNGVFDAFLIDPMGLGEYTAVYRANGSIQRRSVFGMGLAVTIDEQSRFAYPHIDALGSIVGVTDASGSLSQEFAYGPYGEQLGETSDGAGEFGFIGTFGITDEAIDALSMQRRQYSPEFGRFLSPDPAGLGGGSFNFYSYVGNSPVNFIDSTGLMSLGDYWEYLDWVRTPEEARDIADRTYPGSPAERWVASKTGPLLPGLQDRLAELKQAQGLGPNDNGFGSLSSFGAFVERHWAAYSEAIVGTYTLGYFGINPFAPRPFERQSFAPEVTVPMSFDPNDILGPDGVGEEKWISAGIPINYTIRFENDPVFANAPAQFVRITQTLDDDLDPRTFRLGPFGFSGFIFEVPENRAFYATRLDVRDTYGIFVDVFANVDVANSSISWTFTSIDPLTGELPIDRFVGFLPPNLTAPEGDGFVSYTVRPKRTATTGSRIDAEARIFFDENAPIDTPPIFNTLDATASMSAVDPLDAQQADTRFQVSWSGGDGDIGSGLLSYDVFVSVNDQDYELWLDDTNLTEAEYQGDLDSTYAFYTVARDAVGNVELTPSTADTTTTTPGLPDGVSPKVTASAVQAEMTQRSYVDTLSFTFDEATNLSDLIANGSITSAVTITNLGVNADADPDFPVSTTANQFRYEFNEETGSSRLTWSLDEFDSGRQSLADGVYVFTIDASVVSDVTGNLLDGNGDGIGGDDFSLIFHRLSGDADGSGVVDGADMSVVLRSMGRHSLMPNFDPNADLDRDGRITVRDRILVARAMGNSVTPPLEPATLSTLHAGSNSFADQDEEEDDLLNLLADDQAKLAGSL